MEERFSLPILQVLQVVDEFRTGSNRPLLVGAVDETTGVKEECVLKSNGGERMDEAAMVREITAAFMAQTWGIPTVIPVLLRIIPELVESNIGQVWYSLLQNSVGLNYGSIYLRNYQTPIIGQPLNTKEFEQAQLIFAFDLFIQNPDRRKQKPNLMSNGAQMVIFDHELAFSYTQLLFPPSEPWRISGGPWINDMFLHPVVKGKELPYELIKNNLEKINDAFWTDVEQAMPPALQRLEESTKIKQFCMAVVDQADAFIDELKIIAA